LFLLTVADRQGLSYYADASIAHELGVAVMTLGQARQRLIEVGLIAYKTPLYQVLALPVTTPCTPTCVLQNDPAARPIKSSTAPPRRSGPPQAIREVLRKMFEEDD